MHIQLLSTEIPTIENISKLCQKLKDVLHPDDPGSTFNQALWRDFAPALNQKQRLPHLAEVFALKLKQKKLQSRINQITEDTSGRPEGPISPLSQDDIMSSEAVLETQFRSQRRASSTLSLSAKVGSDEHLSALDRVWGKFGWVVTGICLILLGFLLGESRNTPGR